MNINKYLKKNKEIKKKDNEIYYVNKSWILGRWIRLKLILYDLPRIIIGYIYGESREIIFNKEEFSKSFDNLEKKLR